MGIRLADNLKALSVSERLGGAIGTSPHRIQFIGVDTENTNLGYSGVDVGFYIGEKRIRMIKALSTACESGPRAFFPI